MAETEEYWTAEEVSAYLRIPQSTIYKLGQDSVLPGFNVVEPEHSWNGIRTSDDITALTQQFLETIA